MSEKRRDNKGRILRTGESQRKDGRYAYKYIDAFGKPQFVYSEGQDKGNQQGLGGRHRHHRQEDDRMPALRKAERSSQERKARHEKRT